MTTSATATTSAISLKGSVAIVAEFFSYSINSILYQRGIYPPETFHRKQHYGLTMLLTSDKELSAYLDNVLSQLTGTSDTTPTHLTTDRPLDTLHPRTRRMAAHR